MHPLVKAYLRWVRLFKRSLTDEAVGREDWHIEQAEAWQFLQELGLRSRRTLGGF